MSSSAPVNFTYPGVMVTDAEYGPYPIPDVGFRTFYLTGTSLRGPLTPTPISSLAEFYQIFGPRTPTSYLPEAVRDIFQIVNAPVWINRIESAITPGAPGQVILSTLAQNAQWTINSASATSFTVTVGGDTTSSQTLSGLTAAALQTAIQGLASVGSGNALVTLSGGVFTVTLAGSLGATNEAAGFLTATGTGGTVTVVQTNSGRPTTEVLEVTTVGPGSDYNYVASPVHGISVSYQNGTLYVYDAGVLTESWPNVSLSTPQNPNGANAPVAVQMVNNGSNLIQIAWLSTTFNPDNTMAPSYTVNPGSATSFTLTFLGQTTVSLTTSGLNASSVQAALQALSTIGPGGVQVTLSGGLFTVTLANTLAVATQLSSALTGTGTGGSVTVTQVNAGGLQVGISGATDGMAVTAADIAGNGLTPGTGVYAFANMIYDPGFLLAPGYTQAVVGNAMINVATNFYKLAVLEDTFGNGSSVNALINERNQYASPHGHAVYIGEWLQTNDLVTGALIYIPPGPAWAANIALSHNQPGGIGNVGAGLAYTYPNVVGLEYSWDDINQGILNQAGVDIPRNFTTSGQGYVQWAARTISTDVLYTFVQVRIILDVIAVSLYRGLRNYVFSLIDGQGILVGNIASSIAGLLFPLWQAGILFGNTADEAFRVIPQSQELSQLEQGILNVDVYVKPSPIAERINVTEYRVPLNIDLTSGQVILDNTLTLSSQVQQLS
jgi:phage tail sheath protein FI